MTWLFLRYIPIKERINSFRLQETYCITSFPVFSRFRFSTSNSEHSPRNNFASRSSTSKYFLYFKHPWRFANQASRFAKGFSGFGSLISRVRCSLCLVTRAKYFLYFKHPWRFANQASRFAKGFSGFGSLISRVRCSLCLVTRASKVAPEFHGV